MKISKTFLLRSNHDGIFIEKNVLLLLPLDVNTRIRRLLFAPAENIGKSVRVIVAGQVKHRKVVEICQILTILVVVEVLDDRSVVPRVQKCLQLACFWARWVEGERVDSVEERKCKFLHIRTHDFPLFSARLIENNTKRVEMDVCILKIAIHSCCCIGWTE